MALGLVLNAWAEPGASNWRPSSFQQQPLWFEPGPVAGQFLARGGSFAFLLEAQAVQLSLRQKPMIASSPRGRRHELTAPPPRIAVANLRMRFVGANPQAAIHGACPNAGKVNYLIGNDPRLWRTDVLTYAQVQVEELYPGIGLVYYGNGRKLEYDLVALPGADPTNIQMQFEGADSVRVNPAGELVLQVNGGQIRQPKPLLYQFDGLRRREIQGAYRLTDTGRVTFTVGCYDHRRPLVIDPVLAYSTYFGGNAGDLGLAVKVDAAGNVYLAGQTLSTQFPFALPAGGAQRNFGGGSVNGDAFVAKLDPTGKHLIYFTYLGGSGEDGALDLAIDTAGNAYLSGFTESPNFPTRNALYPNISGISNPTTQLYPADGFVAELNTNGSALVYSTYLGGTNSDFADGIAVDASGNAFVTGLTASEDFPTRNAGQRVFLGGTFDAFVAKIGARGSSLVFSTYFGGSSDDEGQGVAVDPNGFAWVTGFTASRNFPLTPNASQRFLNNSTNASSSFDAFVSKFSPSGSLVYSTYLGGYYNDYGYRITTDRAGNAYVTGPAQSLDFPNTVTNVPTLHRNGNSTNIIVSYDAFLTKFAPGGGRVYSTIFGGTSQDTPWDVAVDSAGDAFLVGNTFSVDFPNTNLQGVLRGGNSGHNDVFVTAINSNATAVFYSGYLGGSANDIGYGIAVDAESSAYIVGNTSSGNFPTTAAPLQGFLDGSSDSFVVKIRLAAPLLQMRLLGNELQLQWPVTAPEYILETATSLNSPINWTPLQETPVLIQNAYTLTLPPTNSAALFRLQRR